MLQEIDTTKELVPRPSLVVLEHLQDILDLKTLALEVGKDDFVGRVRMKNILRQEAELREELCAAEMLESSNDLEFSVDGDPVKDHMIAANFFGKFLEDLQKVADRIIFATGAKTRVGEKIPESSLLESRIMITGWRASSFTVQFRLVPQQNTEIFLVSERHKEALRTLDKLFDDSTSEEDLTALITQSASKGAYKKLLHNVANQGAALKLRTKINPHGVALSTETASERVKWMEISEKETQEFLKVTGILLGGYIDTGKFAIQTEDLRFSGAVSLDARDQLQKVTLGTRVNALIKQTSKYKTKAASEPTVTYSLENIIEAPGEENGHLFEP